MVGHQNVGVDRATAFPGVFLQPVEIESLVLIGEKAGLSVVAALDQVYGYTA